MNGFFVSCISWTVSLRPCLNLPDSEHLQEPCYISAAMKNQCFLRALSLRVLQWKRKNRARGISSSARGLKRHRASLICCAALARWTLERSLATSPTPSSRGASTARATWRPFRRFPGISPRRGGFLRLSLVTAAPRARRSSNEQRAAACYRSAPAR